MSKKRMAFPMAVKQGSVAVKIYRVENKGRDSFTVSHHANGSRKLKMFASFEEALADAKAKANALARGELDALHLRAVDARAYVNAVDLLNPIDVPLELAVKDYVEAWKVLGGKASLLEAAKEFARRHLHELPSKLLPDAVDEMLKIRESDGTSDAYQKVLKVYLKQLKEKFHCQLRSVTTGQLADYFRDLSVSPRSKNNARATVGAFFTFCKERGWLPRDHEGVSLVQKFKERPTDITIFSPWEVAQFLRFARTELVPFVAIGAFAGLRTAEIGRLDWSEVHLKERFIEIKAAKSKTASRRLVPISDNLAKWLKPQVQAHGRVVPFDNLAKQIGWLVEDTNAGLRAEAESQRAEARGRKLENASPRPSPPRGEGEAPVKFRQVKWKKNALRHSFISYRVAETQDVAQVALEAGNSPQIIFEHYRELVRLKEAKAWFAIEPESVGEAVETRNAAMAA